MISSNFIIRQVFFQIESLMINSNFITYDIPKSNPLRNDEVEKKFFSESVDFFIAMRFLPSESDSSRKQPCIPTPYHYCFVYKKTQYKLSKLKIKNLFLLHISQEKTHYNCVPSNRQIEIITVS